MIKRKKLGQHFLNSKSIAEKIISEIKDKVITNHSEGIAPPGLSVIQVGGDPASSVYVRNKRKACEEVGMKSFNFDLDQSTTQKELIELVESLNSNAEVNGILIQLPLPTQMKPLSLKL